MSHSSGESARAEASRAGAELEAALEAEVELVRSEIRDETQQRVREIHTQAGERVREFDKVSHGELERLAGAAFSDLIGAARPR
jgi:hypothetical protein